MSICIHFVNPKTLLCLKISVRVVVRGSTFLVKRNVFGQTYFRANIVDPLNLNAVYSVNQT